MKIINCSGCGSISNKVATEKHLVEDIEMDLFLCTKCGKVDFYKSNFEIPKVTYKKCESCGNEVDDRAKICPYCEEVIDE